MDYISVCFDWGVGFDTAVVTGAAKRDKQKRSFRKSHRHQDDALVQSATLILCRLTWFCLNAVTASSNSSIIALNKTWPPNNTHIKNQIPEAKGGLSREVHTICLRSSSDGVIYGRLDVITSSDKQTETKFGQQDHCCKASAYPYRSMLKTWLANKMKSSRIWGREGRRERVVATSWRPGNGRREILPSIFPLTKVEHIGRPRGRCAPSSISCTDTSLFFAAI